MSFDNVILAADHAGYLMKRHIVQYLEDQQNELKLTSIIDYGTFDDQKKVDYPVFAKIVAQAMQDTPKTCGILMCSTGIGMSIAANRFSHVRAALCLDEKIAILAREHNDANVLVLNDQSVDLKLHDAVINIVKSFLQTGFNTKIERYSNRVEML